MSFSCRGARGCGFNFRVTASGRLGCSICRCATRHGDSIGVFWPIAAGGPARRIAVVSYVIAIPQLVTAAATDLAGIGSVISGANAAAAAPTTALAAAGADEVSAAIAALFAAHAQDYQALSARVAAFHGQFVGAVTAAGNAYAAAEAANVAPLQVLEQQVLGVINAPTQLLLGRPLIGNGANAAPGSGQNGGAGGLLFGNGGSGGSGGGTHPGGGNGGDAGLFGSGGNGGLGAPGAPGGNGGSGGLLYGAGGAG
ncbi:hypothetical protein C3479_24770, partial [Mycobacterium kansasii]